MTTSSTLKTIYILASAILLLGSAKVQGVFIPGEPAPAPTALDLAREELQAAKQLWDTYMSTGTSYTFEYTQVIMVDLNFPWLVQVEGGQADAVDSTGLEVSDWTIPSIDSLFDKIQDALDTELCAFEVTYDEIKGYPTSIDIDYDCQIADEEFFATVSRLVPSYDVEQARSDLNDALELWNIYSNGLSTYTYEYEQHCFGCSRSNFPWKVEIEEDGALSARDNTDMGVDLQSTWVAIPSIANLFGMIEDALNSGADGLEVTYHTTKGFPTNINIDYDSRMADEEFIASISMFSTGDPRTDLNEAYALWETNHFGTYTFLYDEFEAGKPFIAYPLTVNVTGNDVTSAIDNDNNNAKQPAANTMETFFAIIEWALNVNAAKVDVAYSNFGSPEVIIIDFGEGTNGLAYGAEITFLP